jgi:sensor domain CHASE-containing protein
MKFAVENEESVLEGTIQDYAWWDDPYQYIRGENPEFIVKNINPEGMSNLNVHLVVVLNRSGSVVYSVRFSPLDWRESPAPSEVFRMIESNPAILQLSGAESRTGLLVLPDGPMAVAYAPILPNNESGEPAGFLIMGRYLNYGQLTRISHIIGYPVAIS